MCGPLLSKTPLVALTRELGANDKVLALLDGVKCVELPCIAFSKGIDFDRLTSELKLHDAVVISSPQSASVLGEAWERAGRPKLAVASVGKGTTLALEKVGIPPIFEPSDATAKVLAKELPAHLGPSVLYPTSNLAADTLQDDLESRGFEVTRLETYTTQPSVWTTAELERAKAVDIVAFASPSAVRSWAERVGTDFMAVVIGPTSAKAAKELSFKEVISPQNSKGLQAWANLIRTTVESMGRDTRAA